MTALMRLNVAQKALVKATKLEEVMDIRDKAEAIRVYVKASGEGLIAQNAAAELKLRAERKAGAMLADMEKKKNQHSAGNTLLPALADLGIEKMQSSRWQKQSTVPEGKFNDLVTECNEEGLELTQQSVLSLVGAGHVSQASGENEWYTPGKYIEIGRESMGSIDLDPASSVNAQKIVQAAQYYTLADDGLSQKWAGRVWLNPPYSKDLASRFTMKLIEHYLAGDVKQAVVLVNNCTETVWFQDMAQEASVICFPRGRIQFTDKKGNPSNSPLQGQALLYFGNAKQRFAKTCGDTGVVMYSSP